MNKVYNVIWSTALQCFVVVSEGVTSSGGKGGRRRVRAAALVVAALAIPCLAQAQGPLPTGGQIVAGSGTISTNGNTMTINQSSGQMITNWRSFSIGAGSTVTFNQPGASSVALNRVIGQDPSQILGGLSANGQVFLVNPNGMVFGKGAQVRTGAFVASTLDLSDRDFLAGHYRFTGTGSGGSIVNQGSLAGKVVALISPSVVNDGTIAGGARGGVTLAAGNDVLLDFDGDGLLSVQVNASTMRTLAENNGLIEADGGTAILTAKGASDALKGIVNNSGTIEAHTIASQGGRILLLGDMSHGEVRVDGKLDASAAGEGNGGYIETSAAKVTIADSAQITTKAENGNTGKTGTWLIDPNDFTIAASGGDITGAALSNQLASNNVTIQSANGATAGNGDIFVNDAVTWAANTLTLHADRNIVVNTAMNGSGTAGLALEYGQGAVSAGNTAAFTVNAPVNLASTGRFSTKLGSDGSTVNYTIVTSLGSATSSNDGTLQGIGGALSGNYVLGANIDASATTNWNAGAGFTPIGSSSSQFTGTFNGLGHTIDGLTINQKNGNQIGLLATIGSTAELMNVGLTNVSINGSGNVGSLVGLSYGAIDRVYATGSVTGFSSVGGLVGVALAGAITGSHAAASVVGHTFVGGAVGYSMATIAQSYATGTVAGGGISGTGTAIGGLLGQNDGGTVSHSYATGQVTGSADVGGLVGVNDAAGTVTYSYATGNVRSPSGFGGAYRLGGLVGSNSNLSNTSLSIIDHSYATGNVEGEMDLACQDVGGLVGSNGGVVQDSYATGSVAAQTAVGGLVGFNGWLVTRSHASGAVTASTAVGIAGGLVGHNGGGLNGGMWIESSYATGAVTGGDQIGGLVGLNQGAVAGSYATGAVTGPTRIGGLVGSNSGTVASDVFWDTQTTGQTNGYGTNGGTFSAIGITTTKMKNPFTFIDAGWDFSSVWSKSQSGNNNGNMVLRSSDSTGYDDYVRLGATNLTRVYGAANPSANSIAVDGTGTSNVLLSWGSAIGTHTNAGTYDYSAGNVVSVAERAGRNAYVDYGSGALTITPATITAIAGITANDKTYDGTTAATLNTTGAAFTGIVSGDTLAVATANGAFRDKNAGIGKTVDITGLTLGGTSASNYVLANATAAATADIAKATIASISGITANDKIYDGTAAATLNTADARFSGKASGDNLTVATATGTFSSKNAGTGKTVIVNGLSLGGADALNYTLTSTSATTTADIARATISGVTGITASNKTYDATTSAMLNTKGAGFAGMVAGDNLTVATAIGAFSDKNAGTGKTVNISGLSLSGADAGNYTLANTTAATTADIAKASLRLSGFAVQNKTYDGTNAATIASAGTLEGVISGDAVTLAHGNATFSDKNAGGGKTVALNGIALTGPDAGNYSLVGGTTATADINRAVIASITGITANNKTYDGNAAATLNTGNARFTGMVSGDSLAVATATGRFSSTNPGIGERVNITGLSLGGADAANYTLADTTATATATINATTAPPLMPTQAANANTNNAAADMAMAAAAPELVDASALPFAVQASGSPSEPAQPIGSRDSAGCVASSVQGAPSSCATR